MKHIKTVPAALLEKMEKRRENPMMDALKGYVEFCTLPVRPSRMKILYREKEELTQTIVPATTIYVRSDGFLDEGHIDRDALTYFVAGIDKAFPLAHVYNGSGHICLGNIFVPGKVPRYSPQQPLETLFLHNDRVLNHGGASLVIDDKMAADISGILAANDIVLSGNINFKGNYEMLIHDDIWKIGSEVYMAEELPKALEIMTSIYNAIFCRKEREN